MIHSDLKPANFLLVRGRLKLIDFGIASSMNPDMTSVVKNNQIGTINYISPEALMDIGNGGDSPNKVKYKVSVIFYTPRVTSTLYPFPIFFNCWIFCFHSLDNFQVGCLVAWLYSLQPRLWTYALSTHSYGMGEDARYNGPQSEHFVLIANCNRRRSAPSDPHRRDA